MEAETKGFQDAIDTTFDIGKISQELVSVDFKMRRDRKRVKEGQDAYWMVVKATPQSPLVKEVKIDLYQTDAGLGGVYGAYGPALTPYPMESGEPYIWDYEDGCVVVIVVRYILHGSSNTWNVAASGVWMCDGYYFQCGKTLKDRSELFRR